MGSSSSKSSQSTTTQNTDKRLVVNEGMGISSDSSTITVNNESVDADIVTRALDTVASADATAGAGFERLLGLAETLFTGAGEMIDKTQTASLSQLETINTAANDERGAIDQKTIIVLAVAGAAALVMTKGKK